LRDVAGRAGRGADDLGAGPRPAARRDHAQKKSLIAAERDEAKRATWRADAAPLAPGDLAFLDETASHVAMTPRYGRAPRGTRVYGAVPRNHGRNVTLIAALSVEGIGAAMALPGALDGPAFAAYVRASLAPALRPGQIVVLDNLAVHKDAAARRLIEARGCRLLFLPPYSPDFSPIELAFSKVKAHLRRAGARTPEGLHAALATALDTITAADARGWFRHCGYPRSEAQLLR
jgi:transposase